MHSEQAWFGGYVRVWHETDIQSDSRFSPIAVVGECATAVDSGASAASAGNYARSRCRDLVAPCVLTS